MKKLFLLGLAIVLFTACQKQEQRYFSESPEINTLKESISAYENGDWDKWQSNFSDTAKVFVNSKESVSVKERLEQLKALSAMLTSYGFDKKDEFIEMVLDKKKETWVYYWAQWNGEFIANANKLSVPVHLAVQFTDGKITSEHIYFDGTAMNKNIEQIQKEDTLKDDE